MLSEEIVASINEAKTRLGWDDATAEKMMDAALMDRVSCAAWDNLEMGFLTIEGIDDDGRPILKMTESGLRVGKTLHEGKDAASEFDREKLTGCDYEKALFLAAVAEGVNNVNPDTLSLITGWDRDRCVAAFEECEKLGFVEYQS